MFLNLTNLCGIINGESFDHNLTNLPNVVNIYSNIYLKLNLSDNLINVSLLNTGSDNCYIENINLKLVSLKKDDYNYIMTYSENIRNPISLYSIREKAPASYLFSMFLKKHGINCIIGFLGSKSSKNALIFSNNKANVDVTASWNLCNYMLEPNEEFVLDSLYFSLDLNYVNLLQNYVLTLKEHFNIAQVDTLNIEKSLRRSKPQLLFSKTQSESTLLNNKEPITVTIDDKTYYPIDITKESGMFDIILAIKEHLILSNTIELNDVLTYLNIINENKLFNGYYELNKLLSLIKTNFDNINILIDDCPFGLILNNNGAIIWRIHSETSFILKKPKYNFDLNFIVKISLFQLLNCKSIKYYVKNNKIKTVLESITSSDKPYISLDDPKFELFKNLNFTSIYVPYIYKQNVFSFVIKDDENILIAVFNLSHHSSSFKLDFSSILKEYSIDGDITDIFSESSLKINKGQLSLKRINPMDCCVFKKAL